METAAVTAPAAGPEVYVGPRPFRTGERLFGRDRETVALTSLLIGERVVLLYSPSGAGKSSLINAGAVPKLRPKPGTRTRDDGDPFFVPAVGGAEGTDAPPVVVRVHTPPPEPPPGDRRANRYVHSTLMSLEQHRPDDGPQPRRTAEVLADRVASGLTLADYVRSEFRTEFPTPDGTDREYRPTVLIFDQFEEVLTLDPTDTDEKRAFFAQLADVLADLDRWVLIAVREDFLAGFDPYLPLLRNRLAARYRLDRLTPEAALHAITGPAKDAGVTFDAAAAGGLVDELRLVRVQRPDNGFDSKPGPYVEPVHLQVVCKSLWDAERPDPTRITADDVANLGRGDGDGTAAGGEQVGVDRVLARYYRDRVAAAARAGGVDERRVRDWFDEQLITAAGSRRPVPRGDESREPYALTEAAFGVLDKAYLIREEARGGTRWVELAHDRLIRPVGRDNARWRLDPDNLHPVFQLDVAVWDKAGRPDHLLVVGAALTELEQWTAARPSRLKEVEAQYIARSREHEVERERAAAEREAAQRVRVRNVGAGVGAGVLAGLIGIVAVITYFQRQREQEARLAATREENHRWLSVQDAARKQLNDRSKLDAQAQRAAAQENDPTSDARSQVRGALAILNQVRTEGIELPAAESLLRRGFRREGGRPLQPLEGPVQILAFSPNGKFLAVGSSQNPTSPTPSRLYAAEKTDDLRRLPVPSASSATAVAFTPDEKYVLWGNVVGGIHVYPTTPGGTPPPRTTFPRSGLEFVRSIQVGNADRDGRPDRYEWVVSVGRDGDGWLWKWNRNLDVPLQIPPGMGRIPPITAVGFTPIPKQLYAGTTDGQVYAWRLSGDNPTPVKTAASTEVAVTTITVRPDARVLAVGSVRPGVRLWAMDPDSKDLQVDQSLPPLRGPAMSDLRFDPSGVWLAGISRDREIVLYQAKDVPPGSPPVYEPVGSSGFGLDQYGSVSAFALGPAEAGFVRGHPTGGTLLVAGYPDGKVGVWDLARYGVAPVLLPGSLAAVTALAVSPDRSRLVVGHQDGTLTDWDLRAVLRPTFGEPLVFRGPTERITALAVSSDGNRVAALCGLDVPRVSVWDTTLGVERVRSGTPTWDQIHLAISESWVTTVDLWQYFPPPQPAGADPSGTNDGPEPLVPARATALAGTVGVAAAGAGWRALPVSVRRWSLPELVASPTAGTEQGPRVPREGIAAAATHPNGQLTAFLMAPRAGGWSLVLGSITPPYTVAPAVPLSIPQTEQGGRKSAPTPPLLAFCADGWALAAVVGGAVVVWPVDPMIQQVGPQQTFSGVVADPTAVAVGGIGRWVAVGDRFGQVQLWDFAPVRQVGRPTVTYLGNYTWGVRSLAFTPDGSRLIAGGRGGDIQVWDLSRGPYAGEPVVLSGHAGEVTALAVAPAPNGGRGLRLFSAGADGTVRVWTLDRAGLIARAEQLLRGPAELPKN